LGVQAPLYWEKQHEELLQVPVQQLSWHEAQHEAAAPHWTSQPPTWHSVRHAEAPQAIRQPPS